MRIIAIKRGLQWLWAGLIAAGALLVAVLTWGQRRLRLGEALGRVEADRERLREVAEKGSDQAVEDEWRRSRQ